MIQMVKRTIIRQFRQIVIISVIYISGPIFLLTTNPKNLALPFLIFPYVWLFASIVCTLALGYRLLRHQLNRDVMINFGLIAMVPVLLALLQSIHQLSVKDIALVVALVLVAGVYISKLDLGRH